ncbi:MAG: class I SAM-dependent methyltransferase [Deltaproteobacteria bacterium]|nr:class I SAM-dependent methyltransferase [Deltaproteobacteria bacterium]
MISSPSSSVPREGGYFDEINRPALRLAKSLAFRGRLLDVGCGRGALGRALREAGFEVVGIEPSSASTTAKARGLEVIESDLTDLGAVRAALAGRSIDVVMMSDVLEHVADPLTALRQYVNLARTGAAFVVSVPNVAVWTSRLALLSGRFDYGDSGVLDRTHLRFFTQKSAMALVRGAGLEVERLDVDPMISRALLPLVKRAVADPTRSDSLMNSRAYSAYLRYGYPLEHALAAIRPGLLAFRLVALGRKWAEGARHVRGTSV